MAQYSILNKVELLEILEPYSISEIRSYEILGGGSENTNYKIESEFGIIVLTISEQKTFEEAQNLTRMLDYLKKHNFSTSELVYTAKNKSLSMFNNKPVMVKKFIAGKIMSSLPAHLLEQIGTDVAKLHKISPPDYLREVMWCGKERFNEVEEYALNSSFDIWMKDILLYVDKYITPDLPKAFIHTDIFDSNIIVNHDETRATIMDFEEATYYFRIFDIAMLFIGLCIENRTINFSHASSILKGYTNNIQLTKIEIQILQPLTVYAAAGVAFWRHKNFNHIKPDEYLKDTYLEMKDLADTIRALSSSHFNLLKP
ncbi:MAG: hypothetical protein DRI75_02270 [Bacteroidetes bacterium]|nr:MAG: hypothetical protein DRI75_02270 [Bacteroidota bacterium]